MAGAEELIFTSHNRRLSEMAVGVEAQVSASAVPIGQFMVLCILLRHVRQAAGRYPTFTLLRCKVY